MATAQELINNPALGIDPITGGTIAPSDDELAHFRLDEDDIAKIALKIYNPETSRARTIQEDVRAVVLEAEFEDSIDATPTFVMKIHDPDWELLNTGALDHTIDVNPGGIPHRWYRFDTYDVNDDDITLTFIIRNAAYLSYHTRPYKISRNKVTRAEFILTMLHHVKKKGTIIKMYCPQLHKKQPIAKTKPASSHDKNSRRGAGFDAGVKLQVMNNDGSVDNADSGQIKVMEEALDEAARQNASPRVMVVGMMVVMIETDTGHARNSNPKYKGVFQQDPASGWPATGDVTKDAVAFFQAAIKAVNADPHGDLGAIGQRVQGAGDDLYAMKLNRARPYAEKAVNAYTGGGGSADLGPSKSYEFMIGAPAGPRGENYLAAMYRLAEEVNWRAYWVADVLHFMSEEDLFKSKARARLRRNENGVEHVTASGSSRKKSNTMTLSVRMEQFVCPVGTVVVFDEGGKALKGRWLVTNIRKSVFDSLGEITLSKPINEKKEPAHEPGTASTNGGNATPSSLDSIDTADGAKAIVEAAVAIAQAVSDQIYVASALRPKAFLTQCLSDHSEDNVVRAARDIAVKGIDAINGPPSALLDEAMKRIAEFFGWTYTKGQVVDAYNIHTNGFRVQFIWRTPKYGGHMGHIHVGALKLTQNCAQMSGPIGTTQRHGGPAVP